MEQQKEIRFPVVLGEMAGWSSVSRNNLPVCYGLLLSSLCTFLLSNQPHERTRASVERGNNTTSGSAGDVGTLTLPPSCRLTRAKTSLKVAASLWYQAACLSGRCPSGAKARPKGARGCRARRGAVWSSPPRAQKPTVGAFPASSPSQRHLTHSRQA